MKNWIALVDCNNFFVGCEKLFRPDLKDRPVIVLSNNDGCVISRSSEVKRMGSVPMGVPLFKIREIVRSRNIHVCSCNHELYADISKRVMSTLRTFTPDVEVYSVDEAFLHLAGTPEQMAALGREIRDRVEKWVGVPVSVGIAPTKTLAKLATEYCKGHPRLGGACCLSDPGQWADIIADIPVEDVWGIGRRLAPRLRALKINTALDLSLAHPAGIRSKFSVMVERIVRELQGLPCYVDENDVVESKKQIICSRSFGHKVTEFQHFREATGMFIERAGLKLRRTGQLCATLSVYAKAIVGRGQNDRPVYEHIHESGSFDYPTDDTRQLMKLAMQLAEKSWRPGLRYCKSGVVLSNLCDPGMVQLTFEPETKNPNSETLMKTLDTLTTAGYNIQFAAQGLKKSWSPQKNLLSPCYTTRWSDIPTAKA